MSDPVLTSELIRAARMLLRWEQRVLADRSGVSLPTIGRLEAKPGVLVAERPTVAKLKAALEAAGVQFTNGREPGVRLVTLRCSFERVDADAYLFICERGCERFEVRGLRSILDRFDEELHPGEPIEGRERRLTMTLLPKIIGALRQRRLIKGKLEIGKADLDRTVPPG